MPPRTLHATSTADAELAGAWSLFRRVFSEGEFMERLSDLSRETGLSPGKMKLLQQVYRQSAVSMRDLARALGSDPSYVTGLVDDLEGRGLVERLVHPDDKRVKTVVLTSSGLDVANAIVSSIDETPTGFQSLTEAEVRQLCQLLEKVADR